LSALTEKENWVTPAGRLSKLAKDHPTLLGDPKNKIHKSDSM